VSLSLGFEFETVTAVGLRSCVIVDLQSVLGKTRNGALVQWIQSLLNALQTKGNQIAVTQS